MNIHLFPQSLLAFSLLSIFLSPLLWAQEDANAAQEIPLTRLSVLIPGELPSSKGDNSASAHIPHLLRAQGKLPTKSEEEEIQESSHIQVNQVTDLVDIPLPANTALALKLEAKKQRTDWRAWHELTLPAGTVGRDLTVLFALFPAQDEEKEPTKKMILLDNSLQKVPLGGVRVINASSHEVFCEIDGKQVRLAPGRQGVLPQAQEQKNKYALASFS